MKFLDGSLFLFLALLTAEISSAESPLFSLKTCKDAVLTEIMAEGSLNHWIPQAPTEDSSAVYRTPTKNFGKWLELAIPLAGRPTLYVTTTLRTQVTRFDAKCTKQISLEKGMDFSVRQKDSTAKWFDDDSLAEQMKKSKTGLIYVWSPEMNHSAKYFKLFRDVAKKMKISFIPILDPRTASVEVDRIAKVFGTPNENIKLNSIELYMRNITIHYPSSVVFHHGKLDENLIVGVMEKPDIESAINLSMIRLAL